MDAAGSGEEAGAVIPRPLLATRARNPQSDRWNPRVTSRRDAQDDGLEWRRPLLVPAGLAWGWEVDERLQAAVPVDPRVRERQGPVPTGFPPPHVGEDMWGIDEKLESAVAVALLGERDSDRWTQGFPLPLRGEGIGVGGR